MGLDVPSKIISLSPILFLSMLMMDFAQAADDLPKLTHQLTPIAKTVSAPPLRLKNMDEEVVDLQALKGKVVVVNFWATWCPPCRREMGSLEKLYQRTKDKGVEVLAVNIGEDLDTVFSFTGTIAPQPTFPILFDTEAMTLPVWKVKGLPTTYIVRADGTLAYRAIGGREFDHPEIVKKIIELTQH